MRFLELQIAYIMKKKSPNTKVLATQSLPNLQPTACNTVANCLKPAWLSSKLHTNPLVMLLYSLAKVTNKTKVSSQTNIASLEKAISYLDIKINFI